MSVFNMPVDGLGRSCPGMASDPSPTDAHLGFFLGDGWKRCVDAVLAGLALVVFSPIIAVLALLVKIDGGSIFLRRRRVGRNGAEFWTYAFRSESAEADRRRDGLVTRNAKGHLDVTFKVNRGMRLTKVGRLLRKTNLDEMPKFWNILRGEMSFFGD